LIKSPANTEVESWIAHRIMRHHHVLIIATEAYNVGILNKDICSFYLLVYKHIKVEVITSLINNRY